MKPVYRPYAAKGLKLSNVFRTHIEPNRTEPLSRQKNPNRTEPQQIEGSTLPYCAILRCAVEPTLTLYPINDTLMAFRFQSFRFLTNYPSVYLHCRAYSCANNDNGAYCDQNCGTQSSQTSSNRRRRDIDRRTVEYEVDSGPIVVIEYNEVARLMSTHNGK